MADTSVPLYQTINNFRFPPETKRQNFEFALNYKPKTTDKFLVTYPKSGTTWTQQIMCLIVNDGIPQKSDKQFIFSSFIDLRGIDCINASLNPRVFKTHLPFHLMPYNKSAKYLCVFRNPKDVCVSFYFHVNNLAKYQFDGDFHEFFKYWINAETCYGDYFEHVLSLWSHRFDDNFSFLVYEQMKYNPRGTVLKIAQFLGEEFVVKLKEDNGLLLNKVLENSTIESMKSELKFDVLTRKGIVGDWKTYFTRAESDLVDEKVRKLFAGIGLDQLWTQEMMW